MSGRAEGVPPTEKQCECSTEKACTGWRIEEQRKGAERHHEKPTDECETRNQLQERNDVRQNKDNGEKRRD